MRWTFERRPTTSVQIHPPEEKQTKNHDAHVLNNTKDDVIRKRKYILPVGWGRSFPQELRSSASEAVVRGMTVPWSTSRSHWCPPKLPAHQYKGSAWERESLKVGKRVTAVSECNVLHNIRFSATQLSQKESNLHVHWCWRLAEMCISGAQDLEVWRSMYHWIQQGSFETLLCNFCSIGCRLLRLLEQMRRFLN